MCISLVDDHYCGLGASLTVETCLVIHSVGVFLVGSVAVHLEKFVALPVNLLKNSVLEDNMHVVVRVFEEQEGEPSMDFALALASWHYPDLVRDLFMVLKGKCSSGHLKVVDLQVGLFESCTDSPYMSMHKFFFSFEVFVSVSN